MTWPAVNYAGNPLDLEVQRVGNLDVNGLLRVSGGALGVGGMDLIPGNCWFVDADDGDDNNDGRCWNNAFATIQTAVNWARYGAATGSLEYVIKNHHKFIFVRPGHYNLTSYISFSGYGMHLIGLGAVPGKDYGVSLNYDGAITSVGVIAFSGSNNSIHNIHIYDDAAVPAIYMAGGDNNLIDGVVIEGDGVNATAGIYAPSMKGSWIRNCVIHNCAKGIHLPGGANMYFIHGGIEGNQIHSDITGAKGIMIDGPGLTVCYNARINRNWIDVFGGGATAIGIDINDTGNILVTDNRILVAGSAAGISNAGLGTMFNQVSVNGTMAGQATIDVNDQTEG